MATSSSAGNQNDKPFVMSDDWRIEQFCRHYHLLSPSVLADIVEFYEGVEAKERYMAKLSNMVKMYNNNSNRNSSTISNSMDEQVKFWCTLQRATRYAIALLVKTKIGESESAEGRKRGHEQTGSEEAPMPKRSVSVNAQTQSADSSINLIDLSSPSPPTNCIHLEFSPIDSSNDSFNDSPNDRNSSFNLINLSASSGDGIMTVNEPIVPRRISLPLRTRSPENITNSNSFGVASLWTRQQSSIDRRDIEFAKRAIKTDCKSEMAIIHVASTRIRVNKYLLAAHSAYFREIFFEQSQVFGKVIPRLAIREIERDEVQRNVFEEFYKYLTGKIDANANQHGLLVHELELLFGVLDFVKRNRCDIVLRAVQRRLIDSREYSANPMKFFQLADKYELLELEQWCLNRMRTQLRPQRDITDNECQGLSKRQKEKISAFNTGEYIHRLRTFSKTIYYNRLTEDQYNRGKTWQQAGNDQYVFSIAQTKSSTKKLIYFHIRCDVPDLNNQLDLNVEVFVTLRVKSGLGKHQDFVRNFVRIFNANSRFTKTTITLGELFNNGQELYHRQSGTFSYSLDFSIDGIWKFDRENCFGTGFVVNKYLLGAYSDKFREGMFSAEPVEIFGAPAPVELQLIERILNPYTSEGRKCNSVCDARQLVGLWNRYKIEPLQLRLAIEQFIQMQFINGRIEIDELEEIAGTLNSQRLWDLYDKHRELMRIRSMRSIDR